MQETLQERQQADIMRLVNDLAVGSQVSVQLPFTNPQNRRQTMKPVKAICTAAIVALALSVPAYAGEISSPGSPSPAPVTASAPGDISSPAIASTAPGDVGFPTEFADILSALFWLL